MNTVILGLGSNISPQQNLPEAVRRLSECVEIVAVSSFWETAAIGSAGPVFWNAAITVKTGFDISTLKQEVLRKIETGLGRVRVADKNASRTIDLDILVFNQEVLDENLFQLDHLILPVAELNPNLVEPGTGKTMKILAKEHCCKPTAVNIGPLLY
jgi:2-amino-4-hydroxy-6-hydroxymethyldihydropteridine diphosphokinase